MQTTIEGSPERRKSTSPRIPVDLLVELCAAEEPKKGARALDSWNDVEDSFTDSYDADGLDLSATGLRLRSAVLPDVGQRLRCRFDLPDTEGRCEAEGRVVWSNDAGRHGEFGLRFESLAPSVESALARWAMDRGPTTLPGTEPAPKAADAKRAAKSAPKIEPKVEASPSFGLARVRFDGVASAIEAEVSLRDETRLDVEQALPFFELGRLASVDADGSTERRRLEHVSLKIENGVPKLVLGFVAAPSSSAGTLAAPTFEEGAEASSSAEATMQDESVDALLAARAETRASMPGPTPSAIREDERVIEARASSSGAWVTEEVPSQDDGDASLSDESSTETAQADARVEKRSATKRALFGGAEDSLEDADPRVEAHRKKKLDEVRRVLLDGDELPEAPASSAGQEAAAQPAALELVKTKARALSLAMGPAFARFVAATRAGWVKLVAAAGPRLKAAYAAFRAWLARVATFVSERVKERAPRLGSLLARGGTKEKRRSTAPATAAVQGAVAPRRQQRAAQNTGSHATQAAPEVSARPRLPLRWVLLAVVALGAVGSLAYALGGGPSEPAPIVVPAAAAPAQAEEPVVEEVATPVVEAAAAPIAPPASEPSSGEPIPAAIPAEPSALAAPSTDEGRLPMPGYPSIGRASTTATTSTSMASSSSFLAAPAAAASAPAAGPITSGRSFGAERVENGQTTSLRMSLAPTALEGQADPHGFTVTIRGALSLDRAALIARSNPAVDRASILNRGDHAVLDVRFVEGRSPAYRIEINGQSVDVILGR